MVGPVNLKIGKGVYQEYVYVAPIEDDMLLGLEFMQRHGMTISIPKGNDTEPSIMVSDEFLESHIEPYNRSHSVAKIVVEKRSVIPPNSLAHIHCKTLSEMPDYVVEGVPGLRVIIPRTVHAAGQKPLVCVMNVGDNYVTMKKNTQIATAFEV